MQLWGAEVLAANPRAVPREEENQSSTAETLSDLRCSEDAGSN